VLALPMHGEVKLRREGLRTRDAHILEWISRLAPEIALHVLSRPEPWPRLTLARRRGSELPGSWRLSSPEPLAVPPLRERHRWWLSSARYERPWPATADGAIVWSPLASRRQIAGRGARVLLDLLDDWTIHPAFRAIGAAVARAYAEWFEIAAVVTANSEATVALARRHGRGDAILLPNGCDPQRFSRAHRPAARFTVGYGGKIGHRLDLGLIEACARALPGATFEFAGPVLMRRCGQRLRALPNVRLLGDIPYARYPSVFAGWDMAWAPHAVGPDEVGGDAIKLYEYRAAGLPVLATKIIGWQRAPRGVRALERSEVLDALAALAARGPGGLPRDEHATPREHTWRFKAERMLELLGVGGGAGERVQIERPHERAAAGVQELRSP
jgi:glycosyltransferase involved in cell wall biosynthesis